MRVIRNYRHINLRNDVRSPKNIVRLLTLIREFLGQSRDGVVRNQVFIWHKSAFFMHSAEQSSTVAKLGFLNDF